ncbi:MAG: diguanylate cyclase (GGDEF)-like protein [Sulfurimonas sp.]|jgi:diguanylate cyclase (GGDEF)-like protein|uniref:GGDEF domain-containing protein n=1 Tax=Sulfurimonas sp. TaxID=2022749 RepID=UPI0039E62B99
MNIQIKLLLILLFLGINTVNYLIIEVNTQDKIDMVFKENLKSLTTHYKILLETQKITASTVHQSTVQIPRVLEILSQANNATKEKKDELRKEFHTLLDKKYQIIKQKGVLQYQFLLPTNESFYRAHKPSKFGDNLTDVRTDFKYTNATKMPTRGLVQGRVAHGFRNTFPLFDSKGIHIGAMEVSFASDSIQWYLNNISNIHSHFLVKKSIFDSKAWVRDDLVLKYHQSSENDEYMITLNNMHSMEICIIDNKSKLQLYKKEINSNILLGKQFGIYVEHSKDNPHIQVISFLPIKNIEDKTLAWIVSYEESPLIKSTLFNDLILKIIGLLISLLIIYFIIKQSHSKEMLKEKNKDINQKHKFLHEVLNLTDDIMFITDFKDVKFSNDKFKEVLKIVNSQEINKATSHNVLDIFQNVDGYLHQGLLGEDELFISLLMRTTDENKIVTIIDENFEAKAFKINVTKTQDKQNCLVTLSDITKMRELQIIAEKKAYIDGLTNVYNRSKFDEIFEKEILCTKRYKSPLSIAILDVDRFKEFNDTYGHLIGDEVLIVLAQTVNTHVRETDTFARWGGEEFVILFKSTLSLDAKVVAKKLKDRIEENIHPEAGKITASFGVTQYQEGDTLKSIFNRCDKALYIAKKNGRNRVEVL